MRGWSLVALVDHCSVYGEAGEAGEPLYGYTGTPFTPVCLHVHRASAGRASHAVHTYTRAWCRADAEGVVYILSPASIVLAQVPKGTPHSAKVQK